MTTPSVEQLLGPDNGPEIRAVMIATVNGSATINGHTQELGNDTDTALMMALRSWAEVVLVGAGTVAKEDYGGVVASSPTPPAPIAVITSNLSLDPAARFFHSFDTPPLILVPDTSFHAPEKAKKLAAYRATGAKVINTGGGSVTECVDVLRARGLNRIVCEGGPNVLGQLVAGNYLDTLYLTVEPCLCSSTETALTDNQSMVRQRLQLDNVAVDSDSTVFLRYRRT